jgi:hypothetical protein
VEDGVAEPEQPERREPLNSHLLPLVVEAVVVAAAVAAHRVVRACRRK